MYFFKQFKVTQKMLVSMLIWKIKLFLLMFDVNVKCEKSLYMQAINISLILVKCKKIFRENPPSIKALPIFPQPHTNQLENYKLWWYSANFPALVTVIPVCLRIRDYVIFPPTSEGHPAIHTKENTGLSYRNHPTTKIVLSNRLADFQLVGDFQTASLHLKVLSLHLSNRC